MPSELAQDLACALDPVALARRMGMTPDGWQADLLRSPARQMILNCSRQSGKSTVASVLALHQALYTPRSLTLILSPGLRQSGELFRKVKAGLGGLGNAVELDEESALRATLANGSRIVSLPGKEETVRGFSGVALLIVDEAARVSDGLYHSIRPMLAVSGGRVMLLSTPWGKRGVFFDVWEHGGDAWERVRITAEQCPRISAVWLAQERASIPDFWYRQEYGCEFAESIDQVFRYEDVQAALSPDVVPLFPIIPQEAHVG